MGVLWDVVDEVRRRLLDDVGVLRVVVGDVDVPASALPAGRVVLAAFVVDGAAALPTRIEATLVVELVLPSGTGAEDLANTAEKLVEALRRGGYPHGTRVIQRGRATIKDGVYPTVSLLLDIAWAERYE